MLLATNMIEGYLNTWMFVSWNKMFTVAGCSGNSHLSFSSSAVCRLLTSCCCLPSCKLAFKPPDVHLIQKEEQWQHCSLMPSIYFSWWEMYHRASLDSWDSDRASVLISSYCYPSKIKFALLRRKRMFIGRRLAMTATLFRYLSLVL